MKRISYRNLVLEKTSNEFEQICKIAIDEKLEEDDANTVIDVLSYWMDTLREVAGLLDSTKGDRLCLDEIRDVILDYCLSK